MNLVEIRYNSRWFAESMQAALPLSVIQYLRDILSLPHDPLFVWELYRQLLDREPDEPGFAAHLGLMNGGMTRSQIVSDILTSAETALLYAQASAGLPQRYSIAAVFQQMMRLDDNEFVIRLFQELLNRVPSDEERIVHIGFLNGTMTRHQMINGLFQTPECQNLFFHLPAAAVPVQPRDAKQIGLFLGYSQKVSLDGEGIGRYTVRLAEGLLLNDDETMVHVFALEQNIAEAVSTFRHFKQAYPDRLFFRSFPSVEWLNDNVPVNAWIVPYVGMELAAQLRQPYVVVLHDLVYIHFYELYLQKQPAFIHYLDPVVKEVVAHATRVIFDCYFIRDHEGFLYLKLPPEKTEVIRLAAPSEEYRSFGMPDEGSFRHKYGIYGSYITFPSAIRLHKNHLRLVEAFLNYKQTPEGIASGLKLVLTDHYVGNALQPEFESLLSRGYSPEALGSLIFINRMPAEDIPPLYKYALGTIEPTEFEGTFPFPILESLSLGTPVAISGINVAMEVIEDPSAFIIFHPHLVHEIQAAIHELVVRHQELPDRQRAAISRMLNRTWVDVAREYHNLISRL